MIGSPDTPSIAFQGTSLIAAGTLSAVADAAKVAFDRAPERAVLFFDDVSSHPIEVDLRGTREDVARQFERTGERAANESVAVVDAPRGPGRPKLGVVAREVTLLPRHWEWLARQPGGASVALRKLVDEAKKSNEAKDRARVAQESAYRFMSTMAGNQPDFEEATRAFFANNSERFEQLTHAWPRDVREHALVLASRAFGAMQYRAV